jgi:hypothetical protein
VLHTFYCPAHCQEWPSLTSPLADRALQMTSPAAGL